MTDLFEEPAAAEKPKRTRKAKVEELVTAPPAAEENVGALVTTAVANPIAVFTDGKRYSEFAARLREEVSKHVPDLTTATGRAAIASLAYSVSRAKASLDKAGLKLTEDARATIAAVNATRNTIKAELTELAAEVRAPLTAWEEAEKDRTDANVATLARIANATTIAEDDTAASVEARGREIHAMTFDAPQWTDAEAEQAVRAKATAVQALVAARNQLRQKEADAAELAELRAREAERIARETAEREARETAEREAREAQEREEAAQRERDAAEQREREAEQRRERERQEAADAARREAEAAAQAERDRIVREAREAADAREAEHARQMAVERAARERVEREAREAEEARVAAARAAEQAAEAERQRVAAEAAEAARIEAERQANAEHRRKVIGEVAEDIGDAVPGLDDETCRDIATAIAGGLVRYTKVSF
jgi:colicin import membrane protein